LRERAARPGRPQRAAGRLAGTAIASSEQVASTQFHEAADALRAETREMHRALVSLLSTEDGDERLARARVEKIGRAS